jgi:hypothetical protein
MEIEGKLLQLMPVQEISSQKGPLKKLEFVIEVESKFPRKVCFSMWNDKIDLFNAKEGEKVKVSFDLESRLYNNRWYTEAKAWKVENMLSLAQQPPSDIPPEDFTYTAPAGDNELDDLPF